MSDGKSPRELSEEQEKKYLSPLATKSTDPLGTKRQYHQERDPFRTEFERDYTRIIHSKSFRRLRHKTQVFISPKNDHLCTRLEHSLYVASIARTISKALELNNELVAAIAVGHDLGHAPFGHHGEEALDSLAKKHGLGFCHELHGLRVVDHLEHEPSYRHCGINLTFAVRDGIVCHYGEEFEEKLTPDREKQPDGLQKAKKGDAPATLEGCVVRWADKVSYLGRDLEDALAVKLISKSQIPTAVKSTLGISNREIIAALVRDLVMHSKGKDYIAIGSQVHTAINALKDFNYASIYRHEKVTRYFEQVDRAMGQLFDHFLKRVQEARHDKTVLRKLKAQGEGTQVCLRELARFLSEDIKSWRTERPEQLVIDYLAGMTDNFFISSFEELFLPKSTV